PPLSRRPDRDTVNALTVALAARLDTASDTNPPPGGRTFQRLNRAEYELSVRALLGIEIDASAYLAPDTMSAGFDNIADVQSVSTTVMEGYLSAASEISRLAVGDPTASAGETNYRLPRYVSQVKRVEGAPFGTRGGLSVIHNFPADGEYVFTLAFQDAPVALIFGKTTYHDEQIEISVDGERVALLDIDRRMDADNESIKTAPIVIRGGPRRLTAAFLRKFEGPVVDVLSPHKWSLADKDTGLVFGLSSLPHVRVLSVAGPYNATGISANAIRQRIFSCRPTVPDEETPCAQEIIGRLAADAYRRPLTDRDLEPLMSFYETGAAEGGFEVGIRSALEATLASLHFVFRIEEPAKQDNAATLGDTRISDIALATRLSFFLWASPPDDELGALARQGRLSDPETLEGQVRRMLADPRAEALATRFAAQWLRLSAQDRVHPDSLMFPDYDQQLADAMRRETELLFHSLLQEERSILELLTADYTFVNQALAEHYDIPGVIGEHFRRVSLEGSNRRGILGHASVLTLTSHGNRTSPVLRGKWVMEVLLGSPPPPPPPNVPALEETAEAADGRFLKVSERMKQHRRDPGCASCHRVIDPIGLALENFDVTGAWRMKDNWDIVDATGELYDGSAINGPEDLRQALLQYSDALITSFTENLLAFGLGRRVEYADMPAIREIVRDAASNGNRLSSLVLGVVKSAAFQSNEQLRRGDVADGDPRRGGR
ncbi:MAG TPA: DUF1592 domain-containing protein, partial [Acidobacteriota bacterium]|nr:DUF1592 domain-containing protein [Acidobacteriota bacterium]